MAYNIDPDQSVSIVAIFLFISPSCSTCSEGT